MTVAIIIMTLLMTIPTCGYLIYESYKKKGTNAALEEIAEIKRQYYWSDKRKRAAIREVCRANQGILFYEIYMQNQDDELRDC